MDKKTQRKLNREARKTARDLKQCSDEKFNEFMTYLSAKELAVGKDISKTTRHIKKLESIPRTNGVTEFGKLEATALGCVATAGAVVALSMLGGLDEVTSLMGGGIGAVVGGGLGQAVATLYDKKPVSNAVNDIRLHFKRNRLAKLTQEREENEYFLDALDAEMSK